MRKIGENAKRMFSQFTDKSTGFKILSGVNTISAEISQEHSVILFVLKGEILLIHNEYKDRKVSEGEMCLLVKGSVLKGSVLKGNTVIICWSLKADFYFEMNLNKEELSVTLPLDFKYNFELLPIHDRMCSFLSLVTQSIKDNIQGSCYYDIIERQFYIYLRHYYSRNQLFAFFYPFVNNDIDFKMFILNNIDCFSNVEDLACLANMSVSTFTRKFKSVFSDSPHQWITKRKSERIYKDLCETSKSFINIVDEYGFSSQTYFITFCKKHFGKTPQQIRKELLVDFF